MDLNSVNITATQVAKNYFSAYVENGFIYSYGDKNFPTNRGSYSKGTATGK